MGMLFRQAVIILADGARADLFADLLRRGRLPAIGESLHVREGTTAFPSTTGPAYMPYLTGCYPGTCNVPGIRWFDKEACARRPFSRRKWRSYVGAETFLIGRDMKPEIRTLFDLIPHSFNLFNSVARGAKRSHNGTWFSRIWYWYYAHLTDRWSLVDRAAATKILHLLDQNPTFLFAVFPGIDEHSHLASPFHPKTVASYELLDRAVGEIVKKLKASGRWGETLLGVVSDHGLSETRAHLGLNQFLERLGLNVFFYPKVVFRYRFNAASMVSGNGMAHIYLKGENGWQGRLPWEETASRKDRLVERLLERAEIDLVAGQRSDGAIVVKSRRGEAVIRGEPGGIRYAVAGSDPFGYPPLPSQMTDRESLERTFTDYPDALAQLLQIFRSHRTGDLVLSAAPGFDLRKRHEVPEHKSSHGSLHREHMKIPIAANVPLPARPIRSVDVFPTVLKLLNRPVPAGIDGLTLFPPSD